MPDFMIHEYLSMSTKLGTCATTADSPESGVSLLHFGLTPGGAARPDTDHETELNSLFSETVAETLQLLLQGFALRMEKGSNGLEGTSNRDIAELQRLIDFVGDFRKSQEITVCGSFPLLVAQKKA